MKRFVVTAVFVLCASTAFAQGFGNQYGVGSNPNNTYVNPYQTGQGTYVPGHQRTMPNRTDLDNYNTRGNFNPSTGAYGTRSPRQW